MYFAQTALAAAYILVLVKVQADTVASNEDTEDKDEENDDTSSPDHHTFVALIDIVFVDNSKRICTGAIIHDSVVITAAHCFLGKDRFTTAKPELTASFVVIGTKMLFDSGYEQYLPIEKILAHPMYEGWTADLALVYTFAAMTSNKPGTVIPLAGDTLSTHMDSNVTVFSWGEARKNEPSSWEEHTETLATATGDDSCSEADDTADKKPKKGRTPLHAKRFRNSQETAVSDLKLKLRKRDKLKSHYPRAETKDEYKNESPKDKKMDDDRGYMSEEESTATKKLSRYLTAAPKDKKVMMSIKPYEFGESLDFSELFAKDKDHDNKRPHKPGESIDVSAVFAKYHDNKQDFISKPHRPSAQSQEELHHLHHTNTNNTNKHTAKQQQSNKKLAIYSHKSYKDWRRYMGQQQNRLFVEIFGYVNVQACRALVEKAMPPKYEISKLNDAVCYTSTKRCIDENDSGAPAVRHGQLVAVTVGGAECEGDHVAVGMKMNCYCSWISDNLPPGATKLKCCKNCCEMKHKEELTQKKDKKHRKAKRRL